MNLCSDATCSVCKPDAAAEALAQVIDINGAATPHPDDLLTLVVEFTSTHEFRQLVGRRGVRGARDQFRVGNAMHQVAQHFASMPDIDLDSVRYHIEAVPRG